MVMSVSCQSIIPVPEVLMNVQYWVTQRTAMLSKLYLQIVNGNDDKGTLAKIWE